MFISIALGTTMGIQPLISFNLGAGNKKVIREIVKTATIVLLSVATFIFVLVQIFNAELTGLFLKDDPATAKIAMEGLRIFVFSVVLSSVNILSSGYFTAINNGKISAVISLSRSILFIVPIILILPEYLGLTGIWLTRPLAELLTLFVVLVFVSRDSILNLKRVEKKSLDKIAKEVVE
jgi:Na+-driven multidrug efflux pump